MVHSAGRNDLRQSTDNQRVATSAHAMSQPSRDHHERAARRVRQVHDASDSLTDIGDSGGS